MKLSERMHLWIEPHRIPDVQDAFDLQEMTEELALLETENAELKRENQKWRRLVNKYHLVILETDENNGVDLDALLEEQEDE